jgi:hypothetical protein
VVENKGKQLLNLNHFFNAGYNKNDVVIVVGDKIVSNYIHNLADFAIDFLLLQHYNFNPLIKTNTILSHRAVKMYSVQPLLELTIEFYKSYWFKT